MEKTPVPQAENHAPNTSGAVVPINDLFIDLRFPPQVSVTVENCPHNFSMIGFVSQMRTRNPGASNPFPGRDLPPLPVQNRPRRCPLCLTNEGASTSTANGETATTPNNISTTLNEVSAGDDAVVPLETLESPTSLAIDEEIVPNVCNADAETVLVEPAANTDIVIDDRATEMNTYIAVRDDQAMEMNTDRDVRDLQEISTDTDSGVRNHHENVNAGEMDVDGNGTDDENDDFRTLREIQQARSLRRLPCVGYMNSVDNRQRVAAESPINSGDPNEVVVPQTVESVPPVEVSINDDNQQEVSSDASWHKKAKKTRFLTDVMHDTESKKTFHWMEDDSAYWSRVVDSSGATTSLPIGQVVGPSVNRTRTKRRSRQEGEASSSRRPAAEKSNDAEPSTSRGRASAPSCSGLQLGNKADRLKRKAAKNHSLVSKKTKSVPLRMFEPNVRSGGSKRCSLSSTMSATNSFRSPSEVAGPSNILSNNHSFGELGVINNNVPLEHTELQIPDSTRVNDLNENIVLQPSEQNLVRRTQLLDLNESDPMEKDNEGPSERRDGNDVVQGSSDEIPIDIVLLMAENQYERRLANASSQSVVPPSSVDNIRRLLDQHDRRNAERPAVGSSGLNGNSFRNPRDGMNIPTTINGAGRSHFNMVQADSSLFTANPQRGVVLEPSLMPFTPNSVPYFSEPSPGSYPRGITISDIKADELKRTGETRPVSSGSGTIEPNNSLEGPSDRYTEDHIPAMQMLSLLNGNSTRGNRFLDNDATTPPGFHPNSNQNRRTRFTNEFCSINRNPAEFRTPEEGVKWCYTFLEKERII